MSSLRKSLLSALVLALPCAMQASAIYQFSYYNLGFTYVAPDFFTGTQIYTIPGSQFYSCNLSAKPGWICDSARFYNSGGGFQVQFSIRDATQPYGSPNTLDDFLVSFGPGTLATPGIYTQPIDNSTITIAQSTLTPVPEPATWGLLGAATAFLGLFASRKRQR